MLVRYRANGRIAEVSDAAGKQLVAARIAESVEDVIEPPRKKPRKSQ